MRNDIEHSLLLPADALALAGLISEVGEAVVYLDSGWVVRYCNDVYLRNIGLAAHEVIGRTPFEFVPQFKRSIFFEVAEACRQQRQPGIKIGFSTLLERWLMVRTFPVQDGMLMMANDASPAAIKAYNLAQQAVKDALTGLGNKLAMEQRVNALLARGEPFSLVFLGLDRFRDINEAHGFGTGDLVLLEAASTLQSATQSGESLFRVSGDEFAVVREGEQDGAAERALFFLEAIKTPMVLQGIRIVLAACAGTVRSPQDGTEYEPLLKRAGLAVREAKRGGKDAIAAYRSELELASKMKAVLETELRLALDGNQFSLMIQPKVCMSGGGVVGGEALIRWHHPRRGILAPAVFLGIAAEMGAMGAIDQWVLRQTLRYCSALQDLGLNIPLSINLSVDSLADMHLATRVASALEDARVPAAMLEVEIPEGTLMRDVGASASVLFALNLMGVQISIDDFGTGYSSFAYLAQFPVHALKIDRSFVNELSTSETSRKIVKAIIRLAHSLSLNVVAEGAETEIQVNHLRRMKCDSVQGYVFSKPLSWPEFKVFIDRHPGAQIPDPMAI